MTGHEAALDALASEGVVILDENWVSFFHASFFDYALRTRFHQPGRRSCRLG